jgi:hypothetical protein
MFVSALLIGMICLINWSFAFAVWYLLYYTLVLLYITVIRSSLDGWQRDFLIANADKFCLLGVAFFFYATYTYYRSDYSKATIVAGLSGGTFILLLLGVFFFLCRRLAHDDIQVTTRQAESANIAKRITYLKLDDALPAADGTESELTKNTSVVQFSSGYGAPLCHCIWSQCH